MPEPYAPRRRTRLPGAEAGGLVARLHWIDALGEAAPTAALLDAARATIEATLPDAMAAEGGSDGAAFAVLHRGRQGTWLLMDWWAHGDILCQRLARAEPGAAAFAPMDGRPLLACVWELEALAEERALWIEHVLTDAPSLMRWRAA